MPALSTVCAPDTFRAAALRNASTPRVDRVKHVIYGASLMQLGDVNDDRPWTVDEETLRGVLKLSSTTRKGLKARFTHPNMSNDGMGSYLGRWRNLVIDEDTVRGDLHIAPSAFRSPSGDLGSYVEQLAEDDPEAFGVSLAGELDLEAMQAAADDDMPLPIRFRALRAADVVDEPAATRTGLFSVNEVSLRALPEQATRLLDAYFGDAPSTVVASRVEAFVRRYLANRSVPMSDEIEVTPQLAADTDTTCDLSSESVPDAAINTEAADTVVVAQTSTEPAALSEREAEKARIRQIRVLCDLAGMQDRFDAFVEADFSVSQVQFALKELMPRRNAVLDERDKTPVEDTADPNAAFRQEYRDAIKAGVHLRSTEDEYVRSRRIDEGLESLTTKGS